MGFLLLCYRFEQVLRTSDLCLLVLYFFCKLVHKSSWATSWFPNLAGFVHRVFAFCLELCGLQVAWVPHLKLIQLIKVQAHFTQDVSGRDCSACRSLEKFCLEGVAAVVRGKCARGAHVGKDKSSCLSQATFTLHSFLECLLHASPTQCWGHRDEHDVVPSLWEHVV